MRCCHRSAVAANHDAASAAPPATMSNRTSRPSRSAWTNPASARIRSCLAIAWRVIGSRVASALALCGPCRLRSSRICCLRRVGKSGERRRRRCGAPTSGGERQHARACCRARRRAPGAAGARRSSAGCGGRPGSRSSSTTVGASCRRCPPEHRAGVRRRPLRPRPRLPCRRRVRFAIDRAVADRALGSRFECELDRPAQPLAHRLRLGERPPHRRRVGVELGLGAECGVVGCHVGVTVVLVVVLVIHTCNLSVAQAGIASVKVQPYGCTNRVPRPDVGAPAAGSHRHARRGRRRRDRQHAVRATPLSRGAGRGCRHLAVHQLARRLGHGRSGDLRHDAVRRLRRGDGVLRDGRVDGPVPALHRHGRESGSRSRTARS